MGTVHEGLGGAFTNPGVSWMKLARSASADGWRRTVNGYGAAAIDAGAAIARAATSQGSLRGMPGRERMGALSEHEQEEVERKVRRRDRKSTRLNSSHGYISYAVFCLKKKNEV